MVSTTDESFVNSLIVYPNPVNDKAYLEFDNNKVTSVGVNIYNVTGKLVKRIDVYYSQDLINLSGMANGLYVFEVKSEGKSHFVKLEVAR